MPGTTIFDMDRTLTREGTWSRFVLQMNRRRPGFWLSLPLFGAYALAYKAGLIPRRAVKEFGLSTLKWATRDQLEAEAEIFADKEVEGGLRARTRDVIARHKGAGDQIVMATAAAGLVARPIAERLGFDVVIATELEWGPDGHLTGRLAGENCYDQEKLNRVIAQSETSTMARPVTAYSDHVSDLPLLTWADAGVAVNPSPPLRIAAPKHGLTIADWEQSE